MFIELVINNTKTLSVRLTDFYSFQLYINYYIINVFSHIIQHKKFKIDLIPVPISFIKLTSLDKNSQHHVIVIN